MGNSRKKGGGKRRHVHPWKGSLRLRLIISLIYTEGAAKVLQLKRQGSFGRANLGGETEDFCEPKLLAV
jgi:hypothetical protein